MTLDPHLDTHTAIVGASGAGKTVTAKGEVEQLLADQRHLAVIDPTGAWYGLRSNAAGDGPGLDIPIFGGLRGDVPIRPGDGAAIAGIIVDQRVSAIVDLSELRTGRDQRMFMAAFVERLRAKPKGNFHLVLDEADEFCPQTAADDVGYQLIENLIWIAKRGRLAGFVLTAITQRPADISKAVLSQVQTLIVHQLIAPQDLVAIDAYLKAHGDRATREAVMSSLPGLAQGERWIYSPRLEILDRGISPALTTFDSSRTPAPGEGRVEPKMLGAIDVGAIMVALAKPDIQEPGKLEMQHSGSAEQAGRIAQLEAQLQRVQRRADNAESSIDALLDGISTAIDALGRAREAIVDEAEMTAAGAGSGMTAATSTSGTAKGAAAPARRGTGRWVSGEPEEAPAAPTAGASDRPLSPPAMDMLSLLKAVAPDAFSWTDLALLTCRMPSGGSMNTASRAAHGGSWNTGVKALRTSNVAPRIDGEFVLHRYLMDFADD